MFHKIFPVGLFFCMFPAGEIWSVVTISPKINNGLAFSIFLKPSGLSGRLSKKEVFLHK